MHIIVDLMQLKSDVDSIKSGLRIVIEELVHLINYEQWNKENKKVVI